MKGEENRKVATAEEPAAAPENGDGGTKQEAAHGKTVSGYASQGGETDSDAHKAAGTGCGAGGAAVSRAERRKMYPTAIDMLAVIGVMALSVIVASIIFLFTQDTSFAGPGFAIAISMQTLPVILFIAWYRRARGSKAPIVSFSKFNPPLVLWGILLILVSGVVLEPLLSLFPAKQIEALNETVMAHGGWSILTAVVLVPILEEVLFRGQILGSVRGKYGSFAALFVSSLFFGLMHISFPAQAVNAFIIALILGYIYMKSGSLLGVITIHAFNNAVSYTMAELFDNDSAAMSFRGMIGSDVVYYIVYGASAALFLVGIAGIVRTVVRQKAAAAECEKPAKEKDADASDNNIE